MTGQSALEHLQLRDYDLITLDLQLPDMNGLAIIDHIRQQESHRPKGANKVPIVIVTGAINEGKSSQPALGSDKGIFWLQKPLIDGQLEELIAQVFEKKVSAAEESQ